MNNEITLTTANKIGPGKLENVIHPYPSQADAIKQAAAAYNRSQLTPKVKRLLGRRFARTRK